MHAFRRPQGFISPSKVDRDLHRLEALVRDLRSLRNGEPPSPETLAEAPLLEGWMLGAAPEYCLVGRAHSHPTVRKGEVTTTSWIWVDGLADGWVRTLSRYYRLERWFPTRRW